MRLWMGVILFFGLGARIGLFVASVMLAHGSSAFSSVTLGACAGGYGTCFVFVVIHNVTQRFGKWNTGKRNARGS
jgi:hypothetical protein